MVGYEYQCPGCGPVVLSRPMGTATPTDSCPGCGEQARRRYTAPLVRQVPAAVGHALRRSEASADTPGVVDRVPPRRPQAPTGTAHPALARLPKP